MASEMLDRLLQARKVNCSVNVGMLRPGEESDMILGELDMELEYGRLYIHMKHARTNARKDYLLIIFRVSICCNIPFIMAVFGEMISGQKHIVYFWIGSRVDPAMSNPANHCQHLQDSLMLSNKMEFSPANFNIVAFKKKLSL